MGGGGSKGSSKKAKQQSAGCFGSSQAQESNMGSYRGSMLERSAEEAQKMLQAGSSRKDVRKHLKSKGLTEEEIAQTLDNIPEAPLPFETNQRVEVDYGRNGQWYPATFRGVDPKGRREFIGVEYDDRPGNIYGVWRNNVRVITTQKEPAPDAADDTKPQPSSHNQTIRTYIRNRKKRTATSLQWDNAKYHTHGTYQDEIRRLRSVYKKLFLPTYPNVEDAKKFFMKHNRYLPVSDEDLVSVLESVPRQRNNEDRIEFSQLLHTIFRFLVKPVEIVESLSKAMFYFEGKDKLQTLVINEDEMRRLMDPWSEYFGEREIKLWFEELKCSHSGVMAYHESVEAAISKVIEQDARDSMHKHVDDGLVSLAIVRRICQRWSGYLDFQAMCEDTGAAHDITGDEEQWIRNLDMSQQVDYRDTIAAMHGQFADREEENFIKSMCTRQGFKREMVEIIAEQKEHNGVEVVKALLANRKNVRELTMHSDPSKEGHDGSPQKDRHEPIVTNDVPSVVVTLEPASPQTLDSRREKQLAGQSTPSHSSVDSRPIPAGARPRKLYSTTEYQRQLREGIHADTSTL